MQRIALLGCGNSRKLQIKTERMKALGGFDGEKIDLVRLDIDKRCSPDIVWDLNNHPLPFVPEELDEIHMYQVLEHIGSQGDYESFFAEFEEYWRVLKPGGLFCATVPMWNSMWAWGDPGHIRIITPGTLSFLDQSAYEQIGMTSMTDYRDIWTKCFRSIYQHHDDHTFYFVLQKV